MAISISLHEAKAQLSAMVSHAENGEEVEITRHGKPVARLVAIADPPTRQPGSGRGTVSYSGDFELSDDEITGLLAGDIEP